MPTYEFLCKTCGAHFNINRHFDEDLSKITCPNGHTQIRRIFSSPTIVYKGSGFYSTDHRKTSPTKA
jgi:putative FmdB family regulatory protein